MAWESLLERTVKFFTKAFGEPPQFISSAPGRVNLIGEHTDYNDGFVLPMAIQGCTLVAGRRNKSKEITVHSVTLGETANISLRNRVERGDPPWSNYIRGVVAGFQDRGSKIGGMDLVIDSTVPPGGGLASSAALEVAVATFLEAATGRALDPMEKCLLCQRAEHEFASVPCGIMDQYASVLAQANHFLLLDCRSRTVDMVPLADPNVAVLVINTNARHRLAEGEYGKRRAECETAAREMGVKSLRDATATLLEEHREKLDPIIHRRARHVVTENERTLSAAAAFRASDWPKLGELMYASHASLRDDFEVSCSELDTAVEVARTIGPAGGVLGCRMTGGGFGGCAVALVKSEDAAQITRAVAENFEKHTKNHATIFCSRPAAGARLIKFS